MKARSEMRDFVVDLLAPMDANVRAMFGGFGIFVDGVMFGLIANDAIYFKTGDANREDYIAAGMGLFLYEGRRGKSMAMPYYEVPSEVLEDRDAVLEWAAKAADVARTANRDKAKSKRK